jgi:hypothetical protein
MCCGLELLWQLPLQINKWGGVWCIQHRPHLNHMLLRPLLLLLLRGWLLLFSPSRSLNCSYCCC